jgi:hypothetical protein
VQEHRGSFFSILITVSFSLSVCAFAISQAHGMRPNGIANWSDTYGKGRPLNHAARGRLALPAPEEYAVSPPIGGPLKNFKPDCGIEALEFKFDRTRNEVAHQRKVNLHLGVARLGLLDEIADSGLSRLSLAERTGPRPTCFLKSQMNPIGGFSAPPNCFLPGHIAKLSSRQMHETPRCGLSGIRTIDRR